ncbi:MAG: hypothetical protein RR869_08935 [Lachnospiraceae bacterium]
MMEKKKEKAIGICAEQIFGRLTVVGPTKRRNHGSIIWECKCSCGNTCFINGRSLVRGDTKSCGCIQREKQDIRNQTFGRLTAIEPTRKKNGRQLWLCRCQCGNSCEVSISNLRNGHTKSCGCEINTEQLLHMEGTCLSIIASKKISKNNTSGIKGVSKQKGKWVANITFKGQHHYLGTYNSIQEATKARKTGEEIYFEPFLEAHREWTQY